MAIKIKRRYSIKEHEVPIRFSLSKMCYVSDFDGDNCCFEAKFACYDNSEFNCRF